MTSRLSLGLLERADELEAIDALAAAAVAGEGGVVLLEGAPGLGKSALLAEGSARASRRGLHVLSARGAEQERDLSFGIVRQLFERVVRGADADQRDRWLAGPARNAAGLFGEDGASTTDQALLVHGLYWLMAGIAAELPMLVVIDDLHWADPASQHFALYAARRVDGLAAGLLTSTRTADGDLASLAAEPGVAVRRLRPLSRSGVAALIAECLGPPAEAFVDACREASGGNPFLLTELLGGAADAGVEPNAQAATTVPDLATDGLLREVARRLAQLGPAAESVARAVAVLDGEADLRHVAALAGIGTDEATAAIAALDRAHLLISGLRPAFVHPLLRSAVLTSMGAPAQGLAHAQAARILDEADAVPARVASHLMACEPLREAWAVEALTAAAAEARAQGSHDIAARLLERALAEEPPAARRPAITSETASALLSSGQARGLEYLLATRRELDDPVFRGVLALRASAPLWFLGEAERLAPLLAESAAELPESQAELRLNLRAARAQSAFMGSGERVGPLLDDALAAVERVSLESPAARWAVGVLALACVFANRPAELAEELARKALGTPRDQEQAMEAGFHPMASVGALVYIGAEQGMEEAFRRLESGVRRRGATFGLAAAFAWRARWHLLHGRLTSAEADALAALELVPSSLGCAGNDAAGVLARVLLESQALEQAASAASTAAAHQTARGILLALPMLESARALRARGEPPRATEVATAVGDLADACGIAGPAALPWRSVAAEAALAAGAQPDAAALAAEELERARAGGVPIAVGIGQRTLGLAQGDVDLLDAAERTLRGTHASVEHAHALLELGAARRRAGARAEAREPLRAALDIARACGALAVAERARIELAASGARVRREARTGVHALTASELRVVELAAAGLTNREIAQQLFVSQKTVETQLYAGFRKLDVRRRADLAAAIAAG